jgi:hypothetical protein
MAPDLAGPAVEARDLLRVSARPMDRRGRVTVDVVGEIDDYTVPLLDCCLRTHAARRGVRRLVVDVAEVTVLGAAGRAVPAWWTPEMRAPLSSRRLLRGSPAGTPPSRGCASGEGPVRRPCAGVRPGAGR